MGLNNDDILSGHVGLTVHWNNGHHHGHHYHQRPKLVLRPAVSTHWIDEVFTRRGVVGAANPGARAATTGALYAQIEWISNKMAAAGFPDTMARIGAITIIMLESDWMTSNVANTDNNYAGIKWINKPYQHATRGLKSPEGGYYAHYSSFDNFLQDFKRVLSINGRAGRPIDATTIAQFGEAIKANGYSTSSTYYLTFNAALRNVNAAIKWYTDQGAQFKKEYEQGKRTFTYDPQKDGTVPNAPFDIDRKKSLFTGWMKDHPILTGVGIATGAILVIKIISHR